MKRFQFLLFTLIAASLDLRAQIPNGGFELWNTTSGYETPDGWDNLNAMTSPMGIYTCEMGAPGVPGASYLELTSRLVSGMGVVPGVAVSGVMDEEVLQASSGFAFGGRPASLTGMWQYMAFGNDQGYIAVYLTKWDSVTNMRETVASKTQNLSGMEMSWANFTINLIYTSGEAPDSAMIVLAASGDSPVNNSYRGWTTLRSRAPWSGSKRTTRCSVPLASTRTRLRMPLPSTSEHMYRRTCSCSSSMPPDEWCMMYGWEPSAEPGSSP